ncbi:MAG: DUF481 domain-containing protein [Deltaproteobacteria bacterium]|nr:MAG: DUF481 domain-containing protein [Deltaproteobacteria bacterium]
MPFIVLFFLVLCLLPTKAHAQVVNVLPVLGQESEDGFQLELAGGGSYLTGNIPFLTFRGNLLMRYRKESHIITSSSAVEFGRGSGEPFLNRQTSHLRYQYELADELVAEAYGQLTNDRVWRLKIRALTGAGLRFDLVEKEKVELFGGLGYMLEHERLSTGEDFGDSGLRRLNHRLGSYFILNWKPDDPIALQQTLYFQPRVDAPLDLRLLSLSTLAVRFKENLSLNLSLQILYNTWTPETILPLDTTTLYQISWSL